MYKKIFVLIVVLGFSLGTKVSAQVNPHAIGARLGGGNYGNGFEVSYQHGLGSANRLEVDVGWSGGSHHSHLGIAGIYHWAWNITNALNWYVGPGAALGLHSDDNDNDRDGIGIGVGGQIGLEFDFQKMGAPILVGLDARPMWNIGGYGGFGSDGSLSVRYIF
ncbi:MAG: hypothetical protein HQK83_14995 [Fibrobacteria bacterium]|nr:hypothetical protein [Fibrobacteria bacterium]